MLLAISLFLVRLNMPDTLLGHPPQKPRDTRAIAIQSTCAFQERGSMQTCGHAMVRARIIGKFEGLQLASCMCSRALPLEDAVEAKGLRVGWI